MSSSLIERTRQWLLDAVTLWLNRGIDERNGGFYECLSMSGEPLMDPKRTMVQARQIYCCGIAAGFDGLSGPASVGMTAGLDFMLNKCSGSNGEFIHSTTADGHPHHTNPDLYAQGFALFGLACGYKLSGKDEYKDRAKLLLEYLDLRRRLPSGGFSEISGSEVKHEANPHMHLFEAAVTWIEVDGDPRWRMLAEEILELCLTRFIDSKTGLLCERFSENWKRPERYIFEPGHHFEWAWLMGRFQKVTGRDLRPVRRRLYDLAEDYGVNGKTGMVLDEVWNDLTPKSKTSRFWPQCERIKAAIQLGAEDSNRAAACAKAADEAMNALFRFLDVPHRGLWFDTQMESGEFKVQPAKASSFYHIAGAMREYLNYRGQL